MHELWIVCFAVASGFTASGLIANAYRLCGFTALSAPGKVLRAAIMVVAGPSVIFESAMRGRNTREWKPLAFWLTLVGLAYWSLALGLFVLDMATSF